MKKIIVCFIIPVLFNLFLFENILAQISGSPPEGFTYQAEARDRRGDLLVNEPLSVRVMIFQNEINGPVVWRAKHKVTTSDYGIFTIVIGEGISNLNFELINWGGHLHFLNVAVKRYKDVSWTNLGTSQLLSVPYALHAKTADQISGNITNNPTIIEMSSRLKQLEESALSGTFVDERDYGDGAGRTYKWVRIGHQVWMAENLAYNHESIEESWAYNNNENNNSMYGRLYGWESTVGEEYRESGSFGIPSGVQGICPSGWHIPSHREWVELFKYLYGTGYQFADLFAKEVWETLPAGQKEFWGRNDKFGFTALLGGIKLNNDFKDLELYGNWWTSTRFEDMNLGQTTGGSEPNQPSEYDGKIIGVFLYPTDHLDESTLIYKKNLRFYERREDALSVRCVRDY